MNTPCWARGRARSRAPPATEVPEETPPPRRGPVGATPRVKPNTGGDSSKGR